MKRGCELFNASPLNRRQFNSRANRPEFFRSFTDRLRDSGFQHHRQRKQAGSAVALRTVDECLARKEVIDEFVESHQIRR